MNRIHDAFDGVRATEKMKTATLSYLAAERERRRSRYGAWAGAVAACAALILAAGLGVFRLSATPVAYISIDVNPSIELSVNCFERVLSATAYNDDGEAVLSGLDLKGKPYAEAVELVLESSAMSFYLTDDAELTFTVSADNAEHERAMLSRIQSCAGYQSNGAQGFCAGRESIQEAHDHGMSFGKYNACQTLLQYDSQMTVEKCRDMTMAEIHASIRAHENGECHSSDSEEEPVNSGHSSHGQSGGHGWRHGQHE